MNWHTINLDGDTAKTIAGIVDTLLKGTVGDRIRAHLPQSLNLYIDRYDDRVEVSWTPTLEVDLPGPIDPDIIKAICYHDHADLQVRLGSVRVNYDTQAGNVGDRSTFGD